MSICMYIYMYRYIYICTHTPIYSSVFLTLPSFNGLSSTPRSPTWRLRGQLAEMQGGGSQDLTAPNTGVRLKGRSGWYKSISIHIYGYRYMYIYIYVYIMGNAYIYIHIHIRLYVYITWQKVGLGLMYLGQCLPSV